MLRSTERFKLIIPWLLAQCGVRKWLVERVFHVPERYAAGFAEVLGKNPHPSGTVEWLRWQEGRFAELVYGGILVNVSETGER
jgi:hypothetical protein